MENVEKLVSFQVNPQGEGTAINQAITKQRVRIFYTGMNRNLTFISEEFANKLLSTIPYTPVCGVYDELGDDFGGHDKNKNVAKAYGVVPENPNITWEDHLDDDGVTRTYACADVYLWTARYAAAKEICGKSQSMELMMSSIKGDWKVKDGLKYFEFTDACFLGLSPLGEDVEPCFEGSAFYSLQSSIKELVDEIKQFSLTQNKDKGGNRPMHFELSHDAIDNALFALLNPLYNEENDWTCTCFPLEVFDNYCIAVDYSVAPRQYVKINYTKGEDDSVALGDREVIYSMFLNQNEKDAIESARAFNGGNFDNMQANLDQLKAQANEKVEIEEKLTTAETDLEAAKNDFSKASDTITDLSTQISTLNTQISDMSTENTGLKEFKNKIEKINKENVIKAFSLRLPKDVIADFSEKIDEYSEEDLKIKLSYELVNSNPELLSEDGAVAGSFSRIPNGNEDVEKLSGAAALIKKHREMNGGNK